MYLRQNCHIRVQYAKTRSADASNIEEYCERTSDVVDKVMCRMWQFCKNSFKQYVLRKAYQVLTLTRLDSHQL